MTSTKSGEEMEELCCNICKISYVTEKELKDHEWSLMHHIKVEHKKKGSVHKCSLCFTTCANLIDYGKHLNGDKHKQAIENSRGQMEIHDPREIQSRLHSGDKEEEQEQEPPRSDTRSHQRSYSQPRGRGTFHGNRRPYRRPGQFYNFDGGPHSFDNPHWHRGGMRQMFPYHWQQPWDVTSPDPWEHPNHPPEDMEYHDNRSSFSQESSGYQSDRGRYNRYMRPERDIDRRRYEQDSHRKNHVRFEDESEETSGYVSQPQNDREMGTSKRRRRNTDVVEPDQPTRGRSTKNSKSRPVESPVVEADSTTDIEMTSSKSKKEEEKSDTKKKTVSKQKKKKNSPRSDEGNSVLERAEKLCKELRDKREKAKKENNKGKKVEKNQEINRQLAKLSEINKSYVKGVLDDVDMSESSVTSLIKPSKLSRTVMKDDDSESLTEYQPPVSSSTRSKYRTNTSTDKPVKDVAKTKSSRTNKKSKGNLSDDESQQKDTSESANIRTSDTQSSKTMSKTDENVRSSSDKVTAKPSRKSLLHRSPSTERSSKAESRNIDDIRREIESEVRKSQNDLNISKDLEKDESDSDMVPVRGPDDRGMSEKEDDSSKLRSSIESTSRESLLKMVNSPRSRKERQQLAEVLRIYAKSQNRLSLPRFNLNMSGLYDNIEHYGDFRLEELSPEVQLQIAELIEADIKPDLDELEKSLLSEIKAERLDDFSESYFSSRSPNVDRLELLEKTLQETADKENSIVDRMNEVNKSQLIAEKNIKVEPDQDSFEQDHHSSSKAKHHSPSRTVHQSLAHQSVSLGTDHHIPSRAIHHSSVQPSVSPKSPQYSQEEQDFIQKFCSPGSPVRRARSPEKHQRHGSQPMSPHKQEPVRPVQVKTVRHRSHSLSALPLDSEETKKKTDFSSSVGSGALEEWRKQQEASVSRHHTETTGVGSKSSTDSIQIEKSIGQKILDSIPSEIHNKPTDQTTSLQKDKCPSPMDLSPVKTSVSSLMKTEAVESTDFLQSDSQLTFKSQSPAVSQIYSDYPNSPVRLKEDIPLKVSTPPHSISDPQKSMKPPISALFGTVPYCTGVSSSTTVTTWSTSAGYLTHPHVMSSSDMSISSGGHTTKVRHPSETSTAESLVDTVYDISIKEEDIRQQLKDVDDNIQRLQKLIEKSTEELNMFKGKKSNLKKEEEDLRLKRINVLQEARDKQKRPDSRHDSDFSDRPTPPLSSTEDSGIPVSRMLPYPAADNKSHDLRTMSGYQNNSPVGTREEVKMHHGKEAYSLRGMQLFSAVHPSQQMYMMSESDMRQQLVRPPLMMPRPDVKQSMMPPPATSGYLPSYPMYNMYPGIPPHQMSPHMPSYQIHEQYHRSDKESKLEEEKQVQKIKVSDLLYQGADLSPADQITKSTGYSQPGSVSQVTHDNRRMPEQQTDQASVEKRRIPETQTDKLSGSSYHSDGRTQSPQRITNIIEEHEQPREVIRFPSQKETTTHQRETTQTDDVIMVSDNQRHGRDVIVITDSPKRNPPEKLADKPQSSPSWMSPRHEEHSVSPDETSAQESLQRDKNVDPNSDKEQDTKLSSLKSFGFITLSNLMGPDNKSSPSGSPREEPVKIPKSTPNMSPGQELSDSEKSHVIRQVESNKDKVNVQYMGSLSHGQDELIQKLRSLRNDQMSYVVVDGENKTMYDKLQNLFHKPPPGQTHKEETTMEHDAVTRDVDSNFHSFGSNHSLGEKIRQYCHENKSDVKEPLITVSDGEDMELGSPVKSQDSPIRMVEIHDSPNVEGFTEPRSPSPYRKKLKTKKERDQASIRKQKEECILGSSSDCNSQEEDVPLRQRPKVSQKPRISDKLMSDRKDVESEVISHTLLEEVQLETESDESRALNSDKFADRFKVKPDFLASLKAAVKSTLAKTERVYDGIRCCGPEEQVSGIQVMDDHIYVSYIGCSVRKFHFMTGEILQTYDCSPNQISCLYVLRMNEDLKLYTGGSSQHLISFNALTGQQQRCENLEEQLQCFHHNWGKLFIGTYTGSILVWSTKTDRNIDAYVCSDRPISCISSATEGATKVILVAAYDSTVFVLSATSGLLIRILEGHTKTVFSLQVDGSIVYSGSGDKTVMEHNLQTGDMTWTHSQASGIITAVCVYEDLLFCASFDKFIRCYNTQDHRLRALYYGADKGLVTQMTVSDDKIISGNRNGTVEVVPINKDKETSCQFEGCSHVFGLKNHLLYHVTSDHVTPDTKMFRCLWKGCKDWMSTKEGIQEAENHMKQHIFN